MAHDPGSKKSREAKDLSAPLSKGERPRRKNYLLYQSKIDAVKEILGAESETAAVDEALSLVVYGSELATGTRAMLGEEYVDVMGIAHEAERADGDGE